MSLGTLGRWDFGDWIHGLVAAFVGGGATAVSGAFSLSGIDPDHFAVGHPQFYKAISSMFLVNGVISAILFLRQKPVPEEREQSKGAAA